MKNNGKRFEENFKKSIPNDVFYYRFRDGTSAWGGNDNVRFQQSNICDNFLYDGNRLYLLELKSTKGKSLPFSNIRDNQVRELSKASLYKNIIAGIVIEFSDLDRAFFIKIKEVVSFLEIATRKSIPIDYLIESGIEIETTKKRVNNSFNIDKLLKEI